MLFLFKGVLFGFVIAAPVGPIGLLCISRTLRAGRWIGFCSGLGAATADAAYAAIAAFGVTSLIFALRSVAAPLHIVGAAFLCYLGVRTIQSSNAVERAGETVMTARVAYGSTLALTLLNPATILSFLALFSAMAGAERMPAANAATLVAGVFLGSALWWLLLASLVASTRQMMSAAFMRRINVLSGVLLIAFGFYALISR